MNNFITVTTGFGYFKKNNVIVSKAILPLGIHPQSDLSLEYIEVENENALNKIIIDKSITETEKNETNIYKTIRNLAITELKNLGKLPQNFPLETLID